VYVYPNPVTNKEVSLAIELLEVADATVELYHFQTSRLEYKEYLAEDSSYALQIETDKLKSGLYILIVRAGTEVRTVKLIKL
jgi:hypothetical protein